MKSYLVSRGGQFYVANQPAQVMLSDTPGRYEIVDTPFRTGAEYDQRRSVCRETAETLVEKYPDIYAIETL